ncbi:MAG: YbaK/EbsC family protein [Acidobacteria bacterium]|nr:YbaK/EbsC family protein [Acidobacteriota bacterium]
MPAKKLKEYLDANGVPYVTVTHSVAYTAQEIASIAHVPGREMAKTVMVKVDGKMAMAVLPASLKVDLDLLRSVTRSHDVELAHEVDFKAMFPDCETGAMPPFGNLYGMKVYMEKSLRQDDEIAFNAGTHKELIWMRRADLERLTHPYIAEFAEEALAAAG